MDAQDRGWGNPRPDGRAFQIKWITKVTVGPFPKGGALDRDHPKVSVNLHKDIAYLASGFLSEIIQKGYRLDSGALDDWGFCYRPNRNNPAVLSNHSWGLAIDVNARTNPNTHDGKIHSDMPKWVPEVGKKWGFSWGGDYRGLTKDPMHFEFLGTRADAWTLTANIIKFLAALKAA